MPPGLNTYYKYGPTPNDSTPHWYEFNFNGQTGAQIIHDPQQTRIVLNLCDGLIGDADLTANGTVVDPGGPAIDASSFQINAGLNDAWFNATTAGQGFLVVVFSDAGIVFVAWFTYDTERPAEDIIAILGESGHRWLTAQGPIAGDTAVLDIFMTAGGVFNSAEPKPDDAVKVGTMTIVWRDCKNATLTYEIDPPRVMGTIELTRIVDDNVALCEALGTL